MRVVEIRKAQESKLAKDLTVQALCQEAKKFAEIEGRHAEPSLYGMTGGKAVGTYLEHKFRTFLTA